MFICNVLEVFFIRCIPKNFLIHTAEIRTPLRHNLYSEPDYSDIVVLKFVRIDRNSSADISDENVERKSFGTLIYDCYNSTPHGFVFSVGQEISIGSDVFTVSSVTPLYDGSKLHHFEIGFV